MNFFCLFSPNPHSLEKHKYLGVIFFTTEINKTISDDLKNVDIFFLFEKGRTFAH